MPIDVRRAEQLLDPLRGASFLSTSVDFHRIAARLEQAGVEFVKRPEVQRQATSNERWKMVLRDSSGNAIELKSYRDDARTFAG